MKRSITVLLAAAMMASVCFSGCSESNTYENSSSSGSSSVSSVSASDEKTEDDKKTKESVTESSAEKTDHDTITATEEEIEESDKFLKEFLDKFEDEFQMNINVEQTGTGVSENRAYKMSCRLSCEKTDDGCNMYTISDIHFDSYKFMDYENVDKVNEYLKDVVLINRCEKMLGYDDPRPSFDILTPGGNREDISANALPNVFMESIIHDFDDLESSERNAVSMSLSFLYSLLDRSDLEYAEEHKGKGFSSGYPDPDEENTDTKKYYVRLNTYKKIADKDWPRFSLEKKDEKNYIVTSVLRVEHDDGDGKLIETVEYSFE